MAFRNAATDICPQCIEPETVPHLYCTLFIVQLTKHLKDASTAADTRCTIVKLTTLNIGRGVTLAAGLGRACLKGERRGKT
jgi:hypothetical protein